MKWFGNREAPLSPFKSEKTKLRRLRRDLFSWPLASPHEQQESCAWRISYLEFVSRSRCPGKKAKRLKEHSEVDQRHQGLRAVTTHSIILMKMAPSWEAQIQHKDRSTCSTVNKKKSNGLSNVARLPDAATVQKTKVQAQQ